MSRLGRRFPPEILTHDEIVLVMKSFRRTVAGDRDRAMLALMYRAGLRIAEALALTPKDIEGHQVRVLHGKGDRSRVAGIDDWGLGWLKKWLDARSMLANVTPDSPVFCTTYRPGGSSLSYQSVYDRLQEAARLSGLRKRIHFHGFRHTHAAGLVKDGFELTDIQAQLGHASLDGTAHYLRKIAPVELVTKIASRPSPEAAV